MPRVPVTRTDVLALTSDKLAAVGPTCARVLDVLLRSYLHEDRVVARIVLFMPRRDLRPAWIVIPLELRRPEAITSLAATITLTPGTVSCDLSEDGRALLVHCLHAPDPDAVRIEIQERYEARLKEIFE